MSDESWRPTASWEMLKLRAALLRRTREFFDTRGFTEVETPLLSHDTVVDRHIEPIGVRVPADAANVELNQHYWLQTSPEFHMKRLLAAGAGSIYQITRAFRSGESGARHNAEFTIVEWYDVGANLEVEMSLVSDLAVALLGCPRAERITYRDAFIKYARIDPLEASNEEVLAVARQSVTAAPEFFASSDRDDLLNIVLAGKVEGELGKDCPTLLYDYPASQAALARLRPDDPRVAERFELYYRGIELCNGYHELLDADVLRQRIAEGNRLRVSDGHAALPSENRLLPAMEHGLPDCTGVAFGFDRAIMLAAGASSLAKVLSFPFDRA